MRALQYIQYLQLTDALHFKVIIDADCCWGEPGYILSTFLLPEDPAAPDPVQILADSQI